MCDYCKGFKLSHASRVFFNKWNIKLIHFCFIIFKLTENIVILNCAWAWPIAAVNAIVLVSDLHLDITSRMCMCAVSVCVYFVRCVCVYLRIQPAECICIWPDQLPERVCVCVCCVRPQLRRRPRTPLWPSCRRRPVGRLAVALPCLTQLALLTLSVSATLLPCRFVSQPVCLCVCLYVYLSVCVCLPVCLPLSVCVCFYLSVCLSVYFRRASVYLSVWVCFCLSVCASVCWCLPACLSACLLVYIGLFCLSVSFSFCLCLLVILSLCPSACDWLNVSSPIITWPLQLLLH